MCVVLSVLNFPTEFLTIIMVGNRRHITPSVKQQLVTMSAYILPCEISHVTQISKRTVNRVLWLQRRTGSVLQRPLQAGRPRTLNGLDIAV
jgi:hypothetical protein